MFSEYIHAALSKATYEIIDDPEPFYGEVPELRGVWASGKTLEECRENLLGVIEGWIALRLRLGLAKITSVSWTEMVRRLRELGVL